MASEQEYRLPGHFPYVFKELKRHLDEAKHGCEQKIEQQRRQSDPTTAPDSDETIMNVPIGQLHGESFFLLRTFTALNSVAMRCRINLDDSTDANPSPPILIINDESRRELKQLFGMLFFTPNPQAQALFPEPLRPVFVRILRDNQRTFSDLYTLSGIKTGKTFEACLAELENPPAASPPTLAEVDPDVRTQALRPNTGGTGGRHR